MTPAETEHFAALRMHVARLHAALQGMQAVAGHLPGADGFPTLAQFADASLAATAALKISEPDVRELLAEADRDNSLVQCRDELAGARHVLSMAHDRHQALAAAARHVVAVATTGTTDDVDGDVLGEAIRDLQKVLPA